MALLPSFNPMGIWASMLGGLMSGIVRANIPGLDALDPERLMRLSSVFKRAAVIGVPWGRFESALNRHGITQGYDHLKDGYSFDFDTTAADPVFQELTGIETIDPSLFVGSPWGFPERLTTHPAAYFHRVAVDFRDEFGQLDSQFGTITSDEPVTMEWVEARASAMLQSGEWAGGIGDSAGLPADAVVTYQSSWHGDTRDW